MAGLNLFDLQVEPLVRKHFRLPTTSPKHEVIRLRTLARRWTLSATNRRPTSFNRLLQLLQSKSADLKTINKCLAELTQAYPIRFLTTSTGGTPLHTLMRSKQTPDRLLARAQLLLALDSSMAKVFDDDRLLPLHALLLTHDELDNCHDSLSDDYKAQLYHLVKCLLQSNPVAKEIQCDGHSLTDFFPPSSPIATLLKSSTPRPASGRTIFDIVRSPRHVPMVAFRKHLHSFPHSVFDSENGFFPLEALVCFGFPTVDTIMALFNMNPQAAVCPPTFGSLLHLLLGSSRSKPTYQVVRCLSSIDPTTTTGSVVRSIDGRTCMETMVQRSKYLKQGRRFAIIDDVDEMEKIQEMLVDCCDLFRNWKAWSMSVPPIFHTLRRGDKKTIAESIGREVKRACTCQTPPPDGALCIDGRGRSPLHHLMHSKDLALHENAVLHIMDSMPHEIMREDETGITPFDVLFSFGRPTIKIVRALKRIVPETTDQMHMMLRAFNRDHPEFVEMTHVLLSEIPNNNNGQGQKKEDAPKTARQTWLAKVNKIMTLQKSSRLFKIKNMHEAESACDDAAINIQRFVRGACGRARHRKKQATTMSATSIQSLARGSKVRSKIILPSKTKLVFGLKHAVEETRRQLRRSLWLKRTMAGLPWSETKELLESDVKRFDARLRSDYQDLHSWMNGKIILYTPQKVVCLLLKKLLASENLLCLLFDRYQLMFAPEESAEMMKQQVKKKSSSSSKDLLLLTPVTTDSKKLTMMTLERGTKLELSGEGAIENQEEDTLFLEDEDEDLEFEKGDIRNHYLFRNMTEEDHDFLQILEDDLKSLDENDWEEGWNMEDDLWEAIELDEIEREKEEAALKLRDHVVAFESAIELSSDDGMRLIVTGYDDSEEWKHEDNYLKIGEVLVGLNKKYFEEGLTHTDQLQMIAESLVTPPRLIFRRNEKDESVEGAEGLDEMKEGERKEEEEDEKKARRL